MPAEYGPRIGGTEKRLCELGHRLAMFLFEGSDGARSTATTSSTNSASRSSRPTHASPVSGYFLIVQSVFSALPRPFLPQPLRRNRAPRRRAKNALPMLHHKLKSACTVSCELRQSTSLIASASGGHALSVTLGWSHLTTYPAPRSLFSFVYSRPLLAVTVSSRSAASGRRRPSDSDVPVSVSH